jgi:excisionase family DNA binding protein
MAASYTVSEAAQRLGVSRISIWRWIRDGQLAATRVGRRTTRISHDDLEGFVVHFEAHRNRGGHTALLEDLAPEVLPDWDELARFGHFAQFYETDEFLVDAVADYVAGGLRRGEAGIIIATEPHRAAIDRCLVARHRLDLPNLARHGLYQALDAQATLDRFMADGMPDVARFASIVGGALGELASRAPATRAFGEMVALLACQGNEAATIRLEELWNDLRAGQSFALFCAYPMRCLTGNSLADLLGGVCAEHARVVPSESFVSLVSADERLRAIARLQAEVVKHRQREEELRSALRARDELLSQTLRRVDELVARQSKDAALGRQA